MDSPFRLACEKLLRIPPDPGPPPGDEASTRVFRAATNFYKYLLALWALKSLFAALIFSPILIAMTVGSIEMQRKGKAAGMLLLLIPVFISMLLVAQRAFALAVLRLDYEKRWYVMTDRSLRVREGVVWVGEMTVTFANIQDISISQGPIQRALGIADLRVDTAGGGAGGEAKNPGLSLHTAWFRGIDNANEVREVIQQKLRQLKDSGLGDREEQVAEKAISSPGLSSSLRAVHTEAIALRRAVEARALGREGS